MNITSLNSDDLFALSCHVYKKNLRGKFLACNDQMVRDTGLNCVDDIVGLTDKDLTWHESAATLEMHDQMVMKQALPRVFIESGKIVEKGLVTAISIKKPLYSSNEKRIIGLVGLTVFDISQIEEPFLRNLSLDALHHVPLRIKKTDDQFHFSKRETEIVALIVRGKTAKQIGKILNLSCRTIEYYLVNIKNKVKVRTKTELIEKLIHRF